MPGRDGRILRLDRYTDNSGLLAAAETLGHIQAPLLDATYGLGIWWRALSPEATEGAVAMDRVGGKAARALFPKKKGPAARLALVGDFRRPPFRPGVTFATIFHDADYKLNGTPTTPASRWVRRAADATVDERYGADERKKWQARIADMLDGIAWWPPCPMCEGYPQFASRYDGVTKRHSIEICAECRGSGRDLKGMRGLASILAPGGKLLVKCMDQVVSGQVRFQRDAVTERAEAAGLEKVEELGRMCEPRWQDPERGQKNAAANFSSLLIFEAPMSPRSQA